MQEILAESLKRLKHIRAQRMRMIAILLVLSLIVSLDVFWVLRQPGLTLAGDADCRITEHTHDDLCQNGENPCKLIEHVHTIECYSDETADVETQLDWQKLFADYPFTGDLPTDLAGIAKTQVGYTESTENFWVDDYGIRHGYTRYGAWYGAPYSDWSAMFVSFCLHYAGADPGEYPSNIGVASMADQWKQTARYAAAGQHTPNVGDVVFFKNNTAGIVTEVLDFSYYVVMGDVENTVIGQSISQKDPAIAGWGLVNGTTTKGQSPPIEPVFDIYINGEAQTQTESRRYTLRNTALPKDLLAYLEKNNGSYFFTLLDKNNQELPKDPNGNYIAQADTGYRLTASFNSPEGFLPGVYEYQIPNGLMVDGGDGQFKLKDGTVVGSWVVTDTGLITLTFNNQIANHADITISASMGIHFPIQDEPIDFDGKITIIVAPPPQQSNPTYLEKWTNPDANTDKLIWHVNIFGRADSQIPGSILTDQILLPEWYKPHSYTQSDMDAGITFGVSDPNGGWHSWTVRTDDPHLIWDESTWSYKIPQTVICDTCGELELGNNGWVYYISYTSTPTPLNTPGTFDYANKVTIDGQTAWGWNAFTHGQVNAQISKNGAFVSDAGGGGFLWEIQATIPGRPNDQKAEYAWAISDEMRLLNQYDASIALLPNDINLATVTAAYNGTIIPIPRIQDATDQDMFVWDNSWTSSGIPSTRTINLLCRCQCTPETCHWGGCGEYWYVNNDGVQVSTKEFCQCWTETQNMTFTLVYKTTDLSIVEAYGALGYKINNQAQLFYLDDTEKTVPVDKDDAVVAIPNLFEKQLTHDFNGHTAHYKITVNEAKTTLTNGIPLIIHDEMTDTLTYISGSLVITAEDTNGNRNQLQQDVDYTVTYDGTGNKKNSAGKPVHVLDIVLLNPQPVMYILEYDTTLIMPDKVTEGIKYSNSASISLWGQDLTENSAEKVYADINISTKSYKVNLQKVSAATGESLPGAIFGLYNEIGGLIATEQTDFHGELLFQTDITQGIILREHILYYMQELHAPPGYQLDGTKYWFCFCDKAGDACEICDQVLAGVTAVRIPFDQLGTIRVTNEYMKYALPATGGTGTSPLILVSVSFIIAPLVYISVRRRKRERKGGG